MSCVRVISSCVVYRTKSTLDLSSFHAPNTLRTTHWDSLEKSLTIFKLPNSAINNTPGLHRRLDLICTVPDVYWTAIVGWYCKPSAMCMSVITHTFLYRTGSKMFERDLRIWAKEQKCGFLSMLTHFNFSIELVLSPGDSNLTVLECQCKGRLH